MKKIYIFVGVLFGIALLIGGILFTPFASNTLIKPLLNAQLEKRLSQPKIKVINLEHTFHNIRLKALIQDTITLEAFGKIYYLAQAFNIKYHIFAKELQIQKEHYKLNLDIYGAAKGNSKKFAVYGKGNAFDSNITYQFKVEENLIKYITAHIKNAKIAQMLLLAKQPPYLNGLLNLSVNMPSLDIKNPKGVAQLQVNNASFNRKVLYNHYHIPLPKDEKLQAKIQTKVAKKRVFTYGDINTTTAKIKIKKLVSTLDFKVAKGYFNLYIKDLSRLNKMTKQKLKGDFQADIVSYLNQKKNIIQALITSSSFGGIAKVKYLNQKVLLSLKKVNLALVEKKLSLPYYITQGSLNAFATVKNLKNYETDFKISANVTLNKKAIKALLPSYKYRLQTKGAYKNLTLYAKSFTLSSSYLKLLASKLRYSLLNQKLDSKFKLTLLDLQKLQKTLKIPLRGKFSLDGDLKWQGRSLNLLAQTKSLGGLVTIKYSNDAFKTQFKNISLNRLLYILKQPAVIKKGYATGKLSLSSIQKLQGKGSLKANALIDNYILQKVYNINLGKNRAFFVKLDSITLKNNRAYTNILLKTKGAIVNLYDLIYAINSNNFKANYGVDIKDLSILNTLAKQKLKGSLKVVGQLSKNGKYILLSGTSSKFDGTINFLLKGDKFTLNAAGISIIKLLDMLNKPKNFDGIAKVDLKYNIKTKLGNFTLVIDNGQFLNSKLVENLKRYANFDLSKELFNKVLIDGDINKNIIIFNVATKSQKVKITIHKGKINLDENTIYAKVRVHFNGNDYNFIVKGALDDPHYKLSYSGVVKEKVQKKLKEGIKKLGLDKEIKKIIPNETKDIDKVIPKDIKEDAKKLFKGLFH